MASAAVAAEGAASIAPHVAAAIAAVLILRCMDMPPGGSLKVATPADVQSERRGVREVTMRIRRRDVALAQAVYYGVTGVWPLVSRRTFEAVTGHKTDWWLVQTFSLTLLPIGAALGMAAARDEVTSELELLGAGAAGVLAGTDVAIVLRRVGRSTYLLDAAASGAILAGWALASRRSRDGA
jgi:hypothetical protein